MHKCYLYIHPSRNSEILFIMGLSNMSGKQTFIQLKVERGKKMGKFVCILLLHLDCQQCNINLGVLNIHI